MSFTEKSLRGFGFSWPAALSLATASQMAYSAENTVKSVVTNDWRMSRCDVFDEGDTQGFIAESTGVLLIAFRGTESLGDWMTNIGIAFKRRPYGGVHRGFYNAYKKVADDVEQRVLSAAAQNKAIWFTGHSLGGALATLGGLEMPSQVRIAGLHTFGQPRMLKRQARNSAKARFGGSYARFVNNDDIVPRIPWNFGHDGTLLHFDHNGNLMPPQLESVEGVEATVSEPPALTEKEFEALMDEIRAIQSAPGLPDGVEVEGAFDASVEGLVPGIADHAMARYIAAVRRQTDVTGPEIDVEIEMVQSTSRPTVPFEDFLAEIESVGHSTGSSPGPHRQDRTEGEDFPGPMLESVPFDLDEFSDVEFSDPFLESAPPSRPPVIVQREERHPFLLRLKGGAWTPPASLKINSVFSGFATVQATASELELLRVDPEIVSIEGSRDAGITELDASVPFVGGDVVQRPPIGETGDAALVGIVDTGVDILHKSFRDDAGNTRILAIWNQRDNSGPTPKDVDPDTFTQDYGTLVLADEIDQHIANVEGGAAPPALLRDPWQHGTHVASIAAGRAVGDMAAGLAPDAKILAVMPNMQTNPGDPPSLGYSNSHIDGLVFLKTASLGGNAILPSAKPIAINVSLGMNAGAHDGTSALEAAFDGVTGGGRDPGCVIVKSAGNERGHGGHAQETLFNGLTEVKWTSTNLPRRQDYLEAWFHALDEASFVLVDPSGNRSDEVSFDRPSISATLGGNGCELRLTENHRDNGDNRLVIIVRPQSSPIQAGSWTLEMVGHSIRSTDARINLWIERHGARALRFDVEQQNQTLSIPGTANTVITVGACNTDIDRLRLNNSSSYGQTRDGRAKPEICAPGHGIKAAGANRADLEATVTMPGTSMAAPHVTGALALILSKRAKEAGQPQFNARQLQKAVLKTVKNFSHVHHPGFGFGVLDVEALYDDLIN